MKMTSVVLSTVMLLAGFYQPAHGGVRYSVTFSNDYGRGWSDGGHGYRGRSFWGRPYYRPYAYHHYRPAYYYAPVVVEPPPVYVAPPVAQSPSYSSNGNYGADLAQLHEKMSRLRGVLQHQTQTGQITPEENDRLTRSLEGIEHDEHARAYDRGGNLAAEDFYDLSRRLDQVNEDMQVALAQ
jgi:hypothetical protein